MSETPAERALRLWREAQAARDADPCLLTVGAESLASQEFADAIAKEAGIHTRGEG